MDRMQCVPGLAAKEELRYARGHITINRAAAVRLANEFVLPSPKSAQTSTLYQIMLACLGEGDRIEIMFGMRDVNKEQGEDDRPSGELVGHSWAVFVPTCGQELVLWEVGRDTPPLSDGHAVRAFKAYLAALASFKGQDEPLQCTVEASQAAARGHESHFRGKPIISRALSPSNVYFSSGCTWFFVDFALPADLAQPAALSRPMRMYDALVLAATVALCYGAPPTVFGVQNSIEGLGRIPATFIRANYGNDPRLKPTADVPLLIM